MLSRQMGFTSTILRISSEESKNILAILYGKDWSIMELINDGNSAIYGHVQRE
jgi:hypothetical protein